MEADPSPPQPRPLSLLSYVSRKLRVCCRPLKAVVVVLSALFVFLLFYWLGSAIARRYLFGVTVVWAITLVVVGASTAFLLGRLVVAEDRRRRRRRRQSYEQSASSGTSQRRRREVPAYQARVTVAVVLLIVSFLFLANYVLCSAMTDGGAFDLVEVVVWPTTEALIAASVILLICQITIDRKREFEDERSQQQQSPPPPYYAADVESAAIPMVPIRMSRPVPEHR